MNATIEDVDYRAVRGLDRAMFLKLTTCNWIRSEPGMTSWLQGRLASAKADWSAASARRPAGTTSRSPIIERPDCSPLSYSLGD